MQPEKLSADFAEPMGRGRRALARSADLTCRVCQAFMAGWREAAALKEPKKSWFNRPFSWRALCLWWLFFVGTVIGGVSFPFPFPVIILILFPMVIWTGAACLHRAGSCALCQNWSGVLYAMLGFGLVVCTVKREFFLRNEQEKASLAVGDEIIAAIDRFEQKTGKRPETLEELVPAYLPTVPRTKMQIQNSEFIYHGHGLGFKFADWKGSMWWYDSRERRWERDLP